LVDIGYERVDLVVGRGQFAVRGGIVDVFPPTDDQPARVEFFGDVVEQVRRFAVVDQRSLPGSAGPVLAPPCREMLLTPAVRARAAGLIGAHPELADLLTPVSEGTPIQGMESLAPLLLERMTGLAELMPAGSIVLAVEPERIEARAGELAATSAEFLAAGWETAALGGTAPVDLGQASFRTLADFRVEAERSGHCWWEVAPFGDRTSGWRPAPDLRADPAAIASLLRERLDTGHSTVISVAGSGTAQRVVEQLAELEVPARLVDGCPGRPPTAPVTLVVSHLGEGLDVESIGLLLLTEVELLGRRAVAGGESNRMPSRRRRGIDPLQLTPGDFVVHEQHGVGRFVELAQRAVGGATREYLVLEYAPSKRGQPADRLYVPTDQLDQVTRYVGGESPSVHRLGGSDWQQQKGRARKAVKQIADELVRLYAARQASPGRAFGPDTAWQRELEDAFPFAETPDQLSTIDEVKVDMERAVPMDRLVCGDVGYGKTEIAVRAAFKAVQDGAQVAVLVPTTLLVSQHTKTLTERFSGFPVRVEALSRFQSPSEVRAVREGLEAGTVDVVVATHRLLSPDTRFKDLGLVIVDEEQRFGVEHKEHLKALRANVDVLAMSATPIPRTLEMAVTGIRELSTIQTPPEQRLPVLTFVGRYDDRQVAAAIRRELLRDGQVFFVHNRVKSIDRVAARIRELVPAARVEIAHGQMPEARLERVILDFWERRVDVLVCTTIVESGLDISNANTLIVDRADRFGLSQLHQIRGRVGRGSERAYAYFMYEPDGSMTEAAHQRLATIAQHTDLGAGMAVAMKDLEIRGAGNMLGGEQSGHIADVGFDLYVRLVGEALAEAKGGTDAEPAEVRVELPVDARIPGDYVSADRLRLAAYRQIAAAGSKEEIEAVAAELSDRFGPIPVPVRTLLKVAELRLAARRVGLTEIVQTGTRIRISPVELPESGQLRLTRLFPGSVIKPATRTILVPVPRTAKVGGKPLTGDELLARVGNLIDTALSAGPAAAKENK